jgi:hypothetical protein
MLRLILDNTLGSDMSAVEARADPMLSLPVLMGRRGQCPFSLRLNRQAVDGRRE